MSQLPPFHAIVPLSRSTCASDASCWRSSYFGQCTGPKRSLLMTSHGRSLRRSRMKVRNDPRCAQHCVCPPAAALCRDVATDVESHRSDAVLQSKRAPQHAVPRKRPTSTRHNMAMRIPAGAFRDNVVLFLAQYGEPDASPVCDGVVGWTVHLSSQVLPLYFSETVATCR